MNARTRGEKSFSADKTKFSDVLAGDAAANMLFLCGLFFPLQMCARTASLRRNSKVNVCLVGEFRVCLN